MHPLFHNVTLDMTKYMQWMIYKPKAVLFCEGDLCHQIGIVLSGEIYISTLTHQEKEEIIQILYGGDLFGDSLAFTSTPYYLGTCIAHKKTQIIWIEKDTFLDLCSKDKQLLHNYLECLANKAFALKQENKLLRHKNISDRILHYLYNETKRNKSNTILLNSVTTFANVLSLPRPSVSRELTKLEKKGYLLKQGKIIQILK